LTKEKKKCGHYCYPSTTLNCCACMDLREVLSGDIYPVYIDGRGWANEGSRNDGYCPICNPKNYDAWEKRILIQREAKLTSEFLLQSQLEIDFKNAENDRKRAAVFFELETP